MTIQLTVDEVAKLRLCSDCVGESFLSAEIERLGAEGVCSYCEGSGKTYSIAQMAMKLQSHFAIIMTLREQKPIPHDDG
jgi:hypothetical protein